jgi:hypothetical protein
MSIAPSSVFAVAASLWAVGETAAAQTPGTGVTPFVAINEPVVVLRHVRVRGQVGIR